MKTARFLLLLGAAILVVGAATGCLRLRPPQALFTASTDQHIIPFTASFDGSLSFHPDGEIASYLWTFGDGASDTGQFVDHTYLRDGTYEVCLTVFDKRGLSTSTKMEIQALNPPPTAGFSYAPKSTLQGDYIVGAGEPITFDAGKSTDDGEIVSYEWYFGDGEHGQGKEVEHRYVYPSHPGAYNVVLTVTDDDGEQATYMEKITVVGGPPCLPGGGGTCR